MTIGNGGMYVVVVVLPAVQAEFGVARADASLPYTVLLIGFGLGGMLMGRLADRRGVMVPLSDRRASAWGSASRSRRGRRNIWWFAAAHCVLIGFLGSSASFAPLIADTSLWFVKHRGIAVAVCASGNYLAGAIWPPIVSHFMQSAGWRATYFGHRRLLRDQHDARWRCSCAGGRRRSRLRSTSGASASDVVRSAVRAVAGRSARDCYASPGCRAAWRCRCRWCTSSRCAAISASVPRAARRCSR